MAEIQSFSEQQPSIKGVFMTSSGSRLDFHTFPNMIAYQKRVYLNPL
jgi:hypothetical protein